MANLIDKDAYAREMIRRAQTCDPDSPDFAFICACMVKLSELMYMAPAELDAKIVVRCAACRHYKPINGDVGVCDMPGGMFRPPVDGYCSRGQWRTPETDAKKKEDKKMADCNKTVETWMERLLKALPDCNAHSIVSQMCPGEFFSNGPGCDDCPYEDMPSIIMSCEKCWNQEAPDE